MPSDDGFQGADGFYCYQPSRSLLFIYSEGRTMKSIKILRCHYDDFISHKGWWAVQENPEVQRGEEITFDLEDNKRIEVVVTGIDAPGCLSQSVPNDFVMWWVIHYEEKE
jgi:hypothetical protein